jgi:hypothetical protein
MQRETIVAWNLLLKRRFFGAPAALGAPLTLTKRLYQQDR